MRQTIVTGINQPLSFREVTIPNPKSSEIVIKIKAATICTSTDFDIIAGLHAPHDLAVEGMLPHDLRVYLRSEHNLPWDLYPQKLFPKKPFPSPMGHEAAGEIIELGSNTNNVDNLVFSSEKLALGDRVATYKIPGAYSDYSCLDSGNVVKVPDSMSDEEASLIEPLIINFNCLKRCFGYGKCEVVAILGQGCQGLFATQIARILGAKTIIVTEPLEYRRELALTSGADVALNPCQVNIVHEIEKITNGVGVDLAIECAGLSETIQTLPYITKRGGIIGQIGAISVPVMFDYGYIHFKHITVIPVDYVPSLRMISSQVKEVLQLIEQKKLRPGVVITHTFPLDRVNEAFLLLREKRGMVIKVAIIP